jgi:hypothetical protein
MNNGDKRSQISAMHFLNIEDAEVENVPGKNIIRVSGEWINLNISKADFKEIEESPGVMCEQELSATITDVSTDKESEIKKIVSSYGLIRFSYTNNIEKVIGTDKFPIHLSYEKSGSPAVIILSCKRSSPELSKLLQSF